jgi:hypothetical protein
MKLVAYVGPKGSGKDSCAAIAKEAGLVAGKIAFAGPLKQICSDVFRISLDVFEDAVKKEDETRKRTLDIYHLNGILDGMDNYLPIKNMEAAEGFISQFLGAELRSPRHILQFVGAEIIRSYDKDWHVKAAFSERALGIISPYDVFAVTDCRFLNEYVYLRAKHDTAFHYVERPEAEERLSAATHVSELEIMDVRKRIHSTIHNTGTLDELRKIVLEKGI